MDPYRESKLVSLLSASSLSVCDGVSLNEQSPQRGIVETTENSGNVSESSKEERLLSDYGKRSAVFYKRSGRGELDSNDIWKYPATTKVSERE